MRFIESIGPYAHDTDLYLKDFSKYLTNKHLVRQPEARSKLAHLVSLV